MAICRAWRLPAACLRAQAAKGRFPPAHLRLSTDLHPPRLPQASTQLGELRRQLDELMGRNTHLEIGTKQSMLVRTALGREGWGWGGGRGAAG